MKTVLALLLGLFVLVSAGCGEPGEARIVRVAVAPASPPNLFEENGRVTGLDLEIFEGYCQARGCRLRIDAHDWQGMLAAVVSGQADVAFSGISITEKRAEMLDFSQPYMENAWHLVSLDSRDLKLDTLDALKQYSVGYARGAAYGRFIKNDLEPRGIYRLDQARLYSSNDDAIADLRAGRLDLAFLDSTLTAAYRRTIPLRDTWVFPGVDRYGFAFPRGSRLREDFDRYLIELGPEKLRAIVARWSAR